MKNTLLTLLLVFSYSIFADEVDPQIDEYNQKLNHYFKNHHDINIQLTAYLQSRKNANYDNLKLILSNVIHLDSDKYSISLADNICHSDIQLTDWCHNKDIHQIRNQIDPKNLNSYLSELDELELDIDKTALLEKASYKSNYSDYFMFHYVLEKAKQIDHFNLQNKNLYEAYLSIDRQSSIEYFDEIQNKLGNSYLFINEYAIDDVELETSKNNSIIMAIGIEMATSLPSLRAISDNCKKIENANHCLKIAEIQIHSKTFIDQLLGYPIKIMALKSLNKDESIINETVLHKKSFSDSHTCYMNTKDIYLAMSFSQYFNKQYINDILEYGEYIAIKNLAIKIHKIQVENGLVTDFDPNDCEN